VKGRELNQRTGKRVVVTLVAIPEKREVLGKCIIFASSRDTWAPKRSRKSQGEGSTRQSPVSPYEASRRDVKKSDKSSAPKARQGRDDDPFEDSQTSAQTGSPLMNSRWRKKLGFQGKRGGGGRTPLATYFLGAKIL